MTQIFNTEFEISMRVLLLLSAFDEPIDIDYIKTADLLSIYGKQYGVSDSNLHGDSSYCFSEIAARHETIKKALRSLVKSNLINVSASQSGYAYSINSNGMGCCEGMTSDYAKEYRKAVRTAKQYLSGKTAKEIHDITYGQLKRRDE